MWQVVSALGIRSGSALVPSSPLSYVLLTIHFLSHIYKIESKGVGELAAVAQPVVHRAITPMVQRLNSGCYNFFFI